MSSETGADDELSTPQGRINAFWNAVAPHYEADPANVPAPGSPDLERWTEAIRSLLPAAPSDVLDVGTGTGFVALIAARLGHRATGIDLADGMLEVARAHAAREGLRAEFRVGDAVEPPFRGAEFDAVTNRSLLWTLREPERAFRNWYAVLRPGGRVVSIYGLSVQAAAPPDPADFFGRHYTAETLAALPAMNLLDHAPLIEAATAAGFVEVTVTALEALRGWSTAPDSDLPYALVGFRR